MKIAGAILHTLTLMLNAFTHTSVQETNPTTVLVVVPARRTVGAVAATGRRGSVVRTGSATSAAVIIPAAAAVPVASTTPAVTISVPTTTVRTSTAVPPVVSSARGTPETTTTLAPGRPVVCDVDANLTAIKITLVHSFDGLLRAFRVSESDKAETPRTA